MRPRAKAGGFETARFYWRRPISIVFFVSPLFPRDFRRGAWEPIVDWKKVVEILNKTVQAYCKSAGISLGARHRRVGAALALLWLVFLADSAAANLSAAPTLAEVRAAFVLNFAKFTIWPAQAFPDAHAPLQVCFAGAGEVRAAMDSLAGGKSIDGRPIVVRDAPNPRDYPPCRILYVGSGETKHAGTELEHLQDPFILVIGETDDALQHMGIIRLLVEGNRMKFDVDVGNANREKIHLSSKLLALARAVVDSSLTGAR
jgi:YfiR/HmsC-like